MFKFILSTLLALCLLPSLANAQYVALPGIPTPPCNATTATAPARPSPWDTPTTGFYYVNNETGSDVGNPLGTPAAPRDTIPLDLPAGAYVEVHGIYTTSHAYPNDITSQGTALSPVFIRGENTTTRPEFRQYLEFNGNYLFIEFINTNLQDGGYVWIGGSNTDTDPKAASCVVLRHNDFSGDLTSGGMFICCPSVAAITVWDNSFHDIGDANAPGDPDVHCIKVSGGVQLVWIVYNTITTCGGDGMQVDAGRVIEGNPATNTRYVWYAGNTCHDNRQTCAWVKNAADIIIAWNTMYNNFPDAEGSGESCGGGQYGPTRLWFIFNICHTSFKGFGRGGDDTNYAIGTDHWIIGNLFFNIDDELTLKADAYDACAISLWGGQLTVAAHNTMYAVKNGICAINGVGGYVLSYNNILSHMAGTNAPQGNHYFIDSSTVSNTIFATTSGTVFAPNLAVDLSTTPQIVIPAPASSESLKVVADVLFTNPGAIDFTLQAGSPAINFEPTDTGWIFDYYFALYGESIAVDISKNPRFVNEGDAGFWEYQVFQAPPLPDDPGGGRRQLNQRSRYSGR